MTRYLDINADELANYASQMRYVALAARCMEAGPPADKTERENCILYLLEVIEDIAARAEGAAGGAAGCAGGRCPRPA